MISSGNYRTYYTYCRLLYYEVLYTHFVNEFNVAVRVGDFYGFNSFLQTNPNYRLQWNENLRIFFSHVCRVKREREKKPQLTLIFFSFFSA